MGSSVWAAELLVNMLSPAPVLALAIASLYGLIFYIVFGRGWTRLLLYWFVGVVGFALGQWVGGAIGLSLFTIGSVNLLEGTVLSLVSLFVVRAWQR
jgi:hypothetical protein